jgi:hypothetical protein
LEGEQILSQTFCSRIDGAFIWIVGELSLTDLRMVWAPWKFTWPLLQPLTITRNSVTNVESRRENFMMIPALLVEADSERHLFGFGWLSGTSRRDEWEERIRQWAKL